MSLPFYEDYWKRQEAELGDFSFKWPIVKKLIPRDTGITILDFGCGKGKMTEEISKLNPQATIIGADVSSTALKAAGKKLPKSKFILIEENNKLDINDSSVDFIVMADVIEHIYNVEARMNDLVRILKPGGKILITTPYHGLLKNLVLVTFFFDTAFDPVGPHIRFFSKRSLLKLVEKLGLERLEFGYFGRFFPFSRAMYVLARKNNE